MDDMTIPRGLGKREAHPRSVRWPADVWRRVERVARDTDNDSTTTLIYLVMWALDEVDAQRAKEASGKGSAAEAAPATSGAPDAAPLQKDVDL